MTDDDLTALADAVGVLAGPPPFELPSIGETLCLFVFCVEVVAAQILVPMIGGPNV